MPRIQRTSCFACFVLRIDLQNILSLNKSFHYAEWWETSNFSQSQRSRCVLLGTSMEYVLLVPYVFNPMTLQNCWTCKESMKDEDQVERGKPTEQPSYNKCMNYHRQERLHESHKLSYLQVPRKIVAPITWKFQQLLLLDASVYHFLEGIFGWHCPHPWWTQGKISKR